MGGEPKTWPWGDFKSVVFEVIVIEIRRFRRSPMEEEPSYALCREKGAVRLVVFSPLAWTLDTDK